MKCILFLLLCSVSVFTRGACKIAGPFDCALQVLPSLEPFLHRLPDSEILKIVTSGFASKLAQLHP